MTPTKPTISLDVSLDNNTSFLSSELSKERKKSDTLKIDFKDNTLLGIDFGSDNYKRVNTSVSQLGILEEDNKTARSYDSGKAPSSGK